MTVDLVLVRHGNTFGPEDPVVWVGAREDLPLVESGRAQAERLGAALARLGWSPTAAVSGGLARQTEHLAIAAPEGTPQRVDPDLAEIDYGAWGGLTTEEIVERFGPDGIEGWNTHSAWPEGAGWGETPDGVRARVRRFARAVADGAHGERVLACSSNGVLRWFLDIVPGGLRAAVADGSFKVGTGKVGILRVHGFGRDDWELLAWNRAPEELEPWN